MIYYYWKILLSWIPNGPVSSFTGSYCWICEFAGSPHRYKYTHTYTQCVHTKALKVQRTISHAADCIYVVGVVEADMADSFLERAPACFYQFSSFDWFAFQSLPSSFHLSILRLPLLFFYFLKREKQLRLKYKHLLDYIFFYLNVISNKINSCL